MEEREGGGGEEGKVEERREVEGREEGGGEGGRWRRGRVSLTE